MGSNALPNPWVGKNYYDIDSKMSTPPAYWLERLYDFDAELVVFPSIQVPFAYCLARRARRTAGINTGLLKDGATPDTKFCLEHRLLPVSLIYRHNSVSWSIDNILEELRARDTWRAGGADKAADIMDENDRRRETKIKADIREDFWHRSGDAWRSYQLRTGAATGSGGTVAQQSRRSSPTTTT